MPPAEITVVDSVPGLLSLLDSITNLSYQALSLFVDLEGVRLGRNGSISIISLYILSTQNVYLIDVHQLGTATFSTTNAHQISLKTVFESSTILKVMFAVRNDSDALYNKFNIEIDGAKDLHLMELASRKGSRDFVAGLAKCIEKDITLSTKANSDWQHMKESCRRRFDPAKGGRYEIFNDRPLRPDIAKYCAQDVTLLPHLYKVYERRLRPPEQTFWRVQVDKATRDRINLSKCPTYNPQASGRTAGPWDQWYIEQAMDAWNEDVYFSGKLVE